MQLSREELSKLDLIIERYSEDEDFILYEDAEKKLWVTDVIPISGVNHKLLDYVDRIKEGY